MRFTADTIDSRCEGSASSKSKRNFATRSDALRECWQKVFEDLTRRDLKLEPPAELKGPERNRWLGVKPTEVETEIATEIERKTAIERGIEIEIGIATVAEAMYRLQSFRIHR